MTPHQRTEIVKDLEQIIERRTQIPLQISMPPHAEEILNLNRDLIKLSQHIITLLPNPDRPDLYY